jgi:hypothetical protein
MEMSERIYTLAGSILAASPGLDVGRAVTIAEMIIRLIDTLPKESNDKKTD